MCCIVAAPVVELCCLGAGEGSVSLWLHHQKCFAASMRGRADWLAGWWDQISVGEGVVLVAAHSVDVLVDHHLTHSSSGCFHYSIED